MSSKQALLYSILILMPIIAGCGPAQNSLRPPSEALSQINTLAIVVTSDKAFEVVKNRATADGTAGAMFGVAGVIIAAKSDENQDKELADALSGSLGEFDSQGVFIKSLSSELKNANLTANRFTKINLIKSAPADGEYDAVVTLDVTQWGLRLIERESELMAGFMDIDMKMKTTSDNKIIWNERQMIAGQGRNNIIHYKNETGLLQNEMKQTAADAASQISNLLIYR